MMTQYILPLDDPRATLEIVGGKGASLARLVAAGLPVPDGFHVTTAAYRRFVAENDLQAGILAAFGRGEVLALDRYGLLGRLYGGAEAAFVGGSLAPVGGHNLLEPLGWGVPAVFGPNMQNAREVRDEVVARGLGSEVSDAGELAEAVTAYLQDAGRAAAVRSGAALLFKSNRGAAARAVQTLVTLGAVEGGPTP